MKKIFTVVLAALIMTTSFSACSNAVPAELNNADIDLTSLSSTLVYSELYNMMITPEDYVGKTVKMKGAFYAYEDEVADTLYLSCVIADATACCQQGLEFTLSENRNYPEDFPDEGDEIEVVGKFSTYNEGQAVFFRLSDAVMNEL